MELSFDIMKQFMKNAPVNIFFKDTECKYLFASEICSLVYADEDGGITGKTDLEIQSIPELGRFYYEDDKKILATGEGSEYVSEIPIEGRDSLYYEIKKNAVRDSDGNIIGIVGIVSNVTNRVRLEKQVEELSIMDGLTQAYNRNYLKYKLEEKRKLLKYPFTVIMSDCNYLKTVNDQYGHEYGDILLRVVANTLKEIFPEDCPVIRMGGDEFLILANETSEEKAAILIQKVQEKLREKSKEKIPLSLAMGSHTINDGPFSIDEAISEADRKMYENKKATRK